MNPLRSLVEYEQFVYTLQQRYASVRHSTLTVIRRGAGVARLAGDMEIGSYRLAVREKLSFVGETGRIASYGYEVWHGSEKLYWYDSQAHPDDPALAATHPHHKHIPPEIKHHRLPAPELSFTQPNLPFLIEEIEHLLTRNEKVPS
ncbi:MAG: DUF6516 family protein [Anaerolineales bacterium]|nr:DUF6516 family protein [Anaerolineales bacterium]